MQHTGMLKAAVHALGQTGTVKAAVHALGHTGTDNVHACPGFLILFHHLGVLKLEMLSPGTS